MNAVKASWQLKSHPDIADSRVGPATRVHIDIPRVLRKNDIELRTEAVKPRPNLIGYLPVTKLRHCGGNIEEPDFVARVVPSGPPMLTIIGGLH